MSAGSLDTMLLTEMLGRAQTLRNMVLRLKGLPLDQDNPKVRFHEAERSLVVAQLENVLLIDRLMLGELSPEEFYRLSDKANAEQEQIIARLTGALQ